MTKIHLISLARARAEGMTAQNARDIADWHRRAFKVTSVRDDRERFTETRLHFEALARELPEECVAAAA